LSDFDTSVIKKFGPDVLIGVDEVGRGPLAGPVVACAAFVPLEAYRNLSDINDSKKLTPVKRSLFFKHMTKCGVRFGFDYCNHRKIDEINILAATFEAMNKAVNRLSNYIKGDAEKTLVLVDGPHKIKGFSSKQLPIIGGDGKSLSIACASIFAKLLRDNWMNILSLAYPEYGFSKHKGYGTSFHLDALKEHGPSPVHRRSFAPVKNMKSVESLC
ncbi:MAG: ribonuclease HII, partial [Elusimicrobiales bacterium]|nr:ribonuclease HII [Elusimicrobiales bacterium]